MKRTRYGTWFDAVLAQVGWWACLLGAASGRPLLGPAVVVALLAVQLRGLPPAVRRRAAGHVLLLGVAGTTLDSLLSIFGVLRFEGQYVIWLAPLWITALWCQFATALPAFAALRSRPVVAALVGALGAPLAYSGGARMGAAALHPEPWLSVLVLGALWAAVFPLMLRLLPDPEDPTQVPEKLAGSPLEEPPLAKSALVEPMKTLG